MRYYNIPIFIPHEGCPHDCSFCNQRKITGVTTTVKPHQVHSMIEKHLSFLPDCKRHIEVAFFGGSFTGLPLKKQENFYRVAGEFRGEIDGIRLSTRPDYINAEVLSLAKAWGVTTIELGAQSAFDRVLVQNLRGHTFQDTKEAAALIQDYGIGLGLQMMTGLPGSNREWDIKTAELLAELKPDCVRVYPTLVLNGTAMEQQYRAGEYSPQTLEEAVETAKRVLTVFRNREIPVIRLGLHAGEELREEGNIVAGPFHPAFGELVENRIWRDRIEEEIKKTISFPKEISIQVPFGEVSKAVGQKRCNLTYFQEKYGVYVKIESR